MRFVPGESTNSYFEALRGYLVTQGCPVAFYSDKHSIFRAIDPNTKGTGTMTQFGLAFAEFNIEILCANSSQRRTGRPVPFRLPRRSTPALRRARIRYGSRGLPQNHRAPVLLQSLRRHLGRYR